MLRRVLRWLMAAFYLAAGVNHFVNPEFYVAIMPPYLPWHLELVWLSGVAEIALAPLIVWPRSRRLAGWGVIALLIAVFPANLHMALHPADFDVPEWGLYVRLPLQLVLVAWAYFACLEPRTADSARAA